MILELADVLALESYPRPRGWYRSDRGNLTRSWRGKRLTIFERPAGSGWYAWSVKDGASVTFSPGSFQTEAAAIEAVLKEVG